MESSQRRLGISAFAWASISFLSASVIVAVIVLGFLLEGEQYTPIAGLIAAASSFLAVVWFTAALMYQAQQLREQREQFAINLNQMHQDSQRNALVVAESVLRDAEARSLSQNNQLVSVADIVTTYVDLSHMKVMLESEDPTKVIKAGTKWFKQEGPALTLMRGIKSAALVYQEATGKPIFNMAKEPEEFVYINGPILWNMPFFQKYQGTSDMVAQFMFSLLPGRTSAQLAYMIALAKTTREGIVKREKLEEDIRAIKEKNYPLPKIAEGF